MNEALAGQTITCLPLTGSHYGPICLLTSTIYYFVWVVAMEQRHVRYVIGILNIDYTQMTAYYGSK